MGVGVLAVCLVKPVAITTSQRFVVVLATLEGSLSTKPSRARPTVVSLSPSHSSQACNRCRLQKIFDILLKTEEFHVLLYYCMV